MHQDPPNPKPIYLLSTKKLLFAPYLKAFIPIYHKWMQDPDTLFLTGSEPLTLEEEFANQRSWLMDPKKYTFIICGKNPINSIKLTEFPSLNTEYFAKNFDWPAYFQPIGDVNLFFHEYIEENEAEIDIMIGDKEARGKGFGKEAVAIMMQFGFQKFKKDKFIAKIKQKNQPSRKLFEKMGYVLVKEIEVFEECQYEFDCKAKNVSPKDFYGLEFEEYQTKIEFL